MGKRFPQVGLHNNPIRRQGLLQDYLVGRANVGHRLYTMLAARMDSG